MKAIKWIITWVILFPLFFPIVFVAKWISNIFDLWTFYEFYCKPLKNSAIKPTDDGGSNGNQNGENTEPKAE
jgi:hypothetical protein